MNTKPNRTMEEFHHIMLIFIFEKTYVMEIVTFADYNVERFFS